MTLARPFVAPADQPVTFVELFFDLVFVFALTQTAHIVVGHVSLGATAQAALVFWMIWWAWTQFTWSLNSCNAEHRGVLATTLAATVIAFVMAVSVDEAFGDGGPWFIGAYVLLRLIGLALQVAVSRRTPELREPVRTFALASLVGLAIAFLGVFAPGAARGWIWLGVAAADLFAAGVGARRRGWRLRASHFAERHGLFVIIALGESLVTTGLAAAEQEATAAVIVVSVAVVGLVCLLWWSYFGAIKEGLEHRLAALEGPAQSRLARDAYSLAHFPLGAGIIGVAAGAEAMVAHPSDPVARGVAVAFMTGLALYLWSAAVAWRRARGDWLVTRLLAPLVGIGLALVAPGLRPPALVGLSGALLVAVALAERRLTDRAVHAAHPADDAATTGTGLPSAGARPERSRAG